MGRRSLEERHIRKLNTTGAKGSSYSVTIPKDIIKELQWREGQKLTVKKRGGSILIEDWKK